MNLAHMPCHHRHGGCGEVAGISSKPWWWLSSCMIEVLVGGEVGGHGYVVIVAGFQLVEVDEVVYVTVDC